MTSVALIVPRESGNGPTGHMQTLHSLPRPSVLHMQIESQQREEHPDGFGSGGRLLRRPRIDHVLMHEGGVAAREGVGAELVIGGFHIVGFRCTHEYGVGGD
jgi:hypothetical protein